MQNPKYKFIVLFFLNLLCNYVFAFPKTPQFNLTATSCGAELKLELSDKTKIYWKTPGTIGFPTKINLSNSQNLKDYNIIWPMPKEKGKALNDIYYVYSGNINIPIDLQPIDPALPIKLKAEISYAICNKKCIPVKQVIEETVKLDTCEINKEPNFVVEGMFYDKLKSKLTAQISFKEPQSANLVFVIEPVKNVIFQGVKIIQRNSNQLTLETSLTGQEVEKLKNTAITVYSNNSKAPYIYDKGIIITNVNPSNYNIFWIIMLAMLGGFILNFMPCVFPVLSLKVLSVLTTISYKPHKTKAALIISSLGIISTFVMLGLLVVILKSLGHEVFFGQNFQNPTFITFLCLVLVLFISSAQDRFNLKLPNLIVNKTSNFRFNNYYIEAFSSGVLASLLSTPCTAPFLGTALSLALSGDAALVLIIFTAIGFGFALPYLLLAFSPALLAKLPRPGEWMEKIKLVLSLLLVGTLIWLLYIYFTQRGIYNAIGMAGILLLIKFFIEVKKGFLSNKYLKIILLLALSFALFTLPAMKHNKEVILVHRTAKLWQNIDLQEIPRLINEGKTVVVDVTADWCVTCKYNKFMVLEQERTLELLDRGNIVAIRADFTSYNSDILFFLKSNNVHGVPFNIIYGKGAPAGIILPTVYSFNQLKEAIDKAQGE